MRSLRVGREPPVFWGCLSAWIFHFFLLTINIVKFLVTSNTLQRIMQEEEEDRGRERGRRGRWEEEGWGGGGGRGGRGGRWGEVGE